MAAASGGVGGCGGGVGAGKEVRAGVRDRGDECMPMADSYRCMAKTITIL